MEALKINATETVKVKASKPKAVKPKAVKPKAVKRTLTTGDKARAGLYFALAVVGLVISLPHLASEVGALTGASPLGAWAMALLVDLGMVANKANISAAGPKRGVCWATLGACTVLSMVLNSHAFLLHADTLFGQLASMVFGCFVPLFIVALSYVGSEILLGHRD